ncbi:GNAT family N-acetyltransferase [Sedimentitalea todarodis]|uniref:GNAT family N-acetyltransferase n=1 Tax=Sedimentitalea todarodis TaxID=1631240 RepID=A0ABU3VMF0_9RHOB|nr:GNAT family N-acetyltransferase [Sedimentitalea todarodis]MDU9006854.1 GNAT family N-acetyltransferase [Sedimentitalea todarodis]
MTLSIREARRGADDDAVWQILQPVVEAGDTFCAEPRGGMPGALAYFWPETARVWIAEWEGEPLGCSYLRPNQTGNGAHVCNAGYCTSPSARGRGVARALLDHSLDQARCAGYLAMQFNFVVTTNTRAIDIWTRAGFDTVGRLPDAFNHPQKGLVDALVMYRRL